MKPKDPLEKDIQNAILAWLSHQPNCMAWPNQSVGIFDPTKKVYRRNRNPFNRLGVSDILGIWNSKPLAIEVKRRLGRPSPEQIAFLKEFNDRGGIGFIARSVDDVIKHLTGGNL